MGGKKKSSNKQLSIPNQMTLPDKNAEEEKRFVNLLHVYTIYKQKFRRLNEEKFEQLICSRGRSNRKTAIDLCKELMKAKQIPFEVDFEKNVGFLSLPRLMPLIALLAERSDYKLKPSLVKDLVFNSTPSRFQEKFAHLMVYGSWFLGRVISDSLSSKDQVNRGNMFNFINGDMGFWWAGVRILDWICYLKKAKRAEVIDCYSFVSRDPSRYRFYTSRAIINMHSHPLYFLSEADWLNFKNTVKTIGHRRVPKPPPSLGSDVGSDSDASSLNEDDSSSIWSLGTGSIHSPYSDVSALSSGPSFNSLASRESID